MPLRPYQRATLVSVLRDYIAGIRRQLIVLPTAAGKTEIVSRIPELLHSPKLPKGSGDGQLFFTVNRDDLIEQAAKVYKRNNPHLKIGIERGEDKASPESDDIIVASVQSVSRKDGVDSRMLRYNPERIRTGIVDEAHFSTGAQFVWLLRFLGMCKGHERCDDSKLLIGVTATPERSDGVGLEALYDKITHEIPIEHLMETGPLINGEIYSYLARPKAYRCSTDFDMSMVKSRKDDFVDADLTKALDSPERNNLILDKYLEYGEGMPGAVYTIGVQHAYEMAELANSRGISAAVIEGGTSRRDRDKIYAQYAAREIDLLMSADALLYGWDSPVASVGLFAKPVKSPTKFRQMVGRFLRRSPSCEQYETGTAAGVEFDWVKPYAILIDFVDILGRHTITSTPTLFGLPADFDFQGGDAIETAKQVKMILQKHPGMGLQAKTLTELRSQVDSIDVMRPPQMRADVKKLSKFSWLEIYEGILHLGTQAFNLEVRQNTLGQFEVYQTRQGIRDHVADAGTLREALAAADAKVPRGEQNVLRSRAKWREEEPSFKQCMSIWKSDPRVAEKWPDLGDERGFLRFYHYAKEQHAAGAVNYSKGAMSRVIDKLKAPQPVGV